MSFKDATKDQVIWDMCYWKMWYKEIAIYMGYAILLVITLLNIIASKIIGWLITKHRYETHSETEKHLTNYQVFALTVNTGLISFFANIKITAWDFCPMLDIISKVPMF